MVEKIVKGYKISDDCYTSDNIHVGIADAVISLMIDGNGFQIPVDALREVIA